MNFNTLNTITTDLLNIIRASDISNSEAISKRQVEDWVHQYRALLLKQDLDKGKKPNPDYIQEIGNLALTATELTGDDITSLGVESGLYIYKTTLELPKTLDLNFTSGFTYIGTPLGYEIQLVPEGRTRWQKYKKYTTKMRMAFLRNGHIYIINSEALQFINVRGVFEIPPELGRFVNPITDQPYFNLDSKYPVPANMVPVLKKMILEQELKITVATESDTSNDARHNPEA